MTKYLLNIATFLFIFGKLLCHWVFTIHSSDAVIYRHIYYMSDFIAHVIFMFAIYLFGFKKEHLTTFLFVGVIYFIETIYYCLYMFKICPFDGSIESYSVSIIEFTLTIIYTLNLFYKWLK